MDSEAGTSSGNDQALSSAQATTDQGTGTAASSDGGSTATPGQASSAPSWQSIDWAQVDIHEVIKNVPALQGAVGNLSQRQAQQLARRMVDDQRASQEAADAAARIKSERLEKLRLAREDPDKLAEQITEEVTRQDYNDWQRDIRSGMQAEFTGYIASEVQAVYDDPDVQEIMKTADRPTLEKLDWRSHNGLASWVKTVNKMVAQHHAEKRADELAKARSKASDKERVVEGAREDAGDGVDLGLAGGVPGGRLFTRNDLATMSLEEYRKYKKVIAVQEREGRIV